MKITSQLIGYSLAAFIISSIGYYYEFIQITVNSITSQLIGYSLAFIFFHSIRSFKDLKNNHKGDE